MMGKKRMARNEDSDTEKRRSRQIRFGRWNRAHQGIDAIGPSGYRVSNRESRLSQRERIMTRKAESDQPIDGELELAERRQSVTAPEAVWCVDSCVSISDATVNNLRERLDGEMGIK